MSNYTSCAEGFWPQISAASGGISFMTSFVAQIPQLIETYRDKSVEGLSPVFLLCWLTGDVTGLIGAILTGQLHFQILLATYYMANDLVLCGQYFYYGIVHKNKLATPGHESATFEERLRLVRSCGSNPSVKFHTSRRWWLFSFLFSQPSLSNAFSLPVFAAVSSDDSSPLQASHNNAHTLLGQTLSWFGAMAYFSARIPQLIKNHRRKSTDGLSPLLFASTLLANLTYTLSIFTSCAFISAPDRVTFIMNELPFIVGSAGTALFDLFYFYQHYVLYADDQLIRQLESDELTPLIH